MNFLIGTLAKCFAFLIWLLPRRLQLLLGDGLALATFDLIRVRRDVVLQHLKLAFPEKSDSERLIIARNCYRNLGRSLMEYCLIPFLSKENLNKYFVFEGLSYLEEALAKKKGVLGLTLHLGNGDFGLSGMVLSGIPAVLISKKFKVKLANDLWFGLREEMGVRFIPEEKSSFQILKSLKKNDLILFVLDQFMGPPVGVKTTFFGHETGTAAGLALFANRSGAPVLPVYSVRRDDGVTRIIIEAPLPLVEDADLDVSVQKTTQLYTDHLEKLVRKYPDQWMWLHRRWKVFEVR